MALAARLGACGLRGASGGCARSCRPHKEKKKKKKKNARVCVHLHGVGVSGCWCGRCSVEAGFTVGGGQSWGCVVCVRTLGLDRARGLVSFQPFGSWGEGEVVWEVWRWGGGSGVAEEGSLNRVLATAPTSAVTTTTPPLPPHHHPPSLRQNPSTLNDAQWHDQVAEQQSAQSVGQQQLVVQVGRVAAAGHHAPGRVRLAHWQGGHARAHGLVANQGEPLVDLFFLI